MLPPPTRTWRCLVALWQFIALLVLIGSLLVYASVITHRLGRVNARLNRIEALLANSRTIGSAETRASGGHLTIRDLRQLSSGATRYGSGSSSAVSERRDALKTTPDLMSSRGATAERGGSVGLGSAKGEALKAHREQAMNAMSEDPAATILESRDAHATNSGPQGPAACRPPRDDSVAMTSRDMTLFLSAQRRRRRARLGY
jgi:hypothetical protein